jgi:hypothetical protein
MPKDATIDSLYFNKTTVAEQTEIRRWRRVRDAMREIQFQLDHIWLEKRDPFVRRFYSLMDDLSAWGCYLCEYAHHADEGGVKRDYCECNECRGCGNKFCGGV